MLLLLLEKLSLSLWCTLCIVYCMCVCVQLQFTQHRPSLILQKCKHYLAKHKHAHMYTQLIGSVGAGCQNKKGGGWDVVSHFYFLLLAELLSPVLSCASLKLRCKMHSPCTPYLIPQPICISSVQKLKISLLPISPKYRPRPLALSISYATNSSSIAKFCNEMLQREQIVVLCTRRALVTRIRSAAVSSCHLT